MADSWREKQGKAAAAAALKAGSAKHPCVHEIRVSTSDSCCWVVTVKQIMSAGGSGEIPLLRGRRPRTADETQEAGKTGYISDDASRATAVQIYFGQLCFECNLVCWKFRVSNGSRCCKRGSNVPRNGVIIVIQDKDAYCQRHSVWGGNVGVKTLLYILFKLQKTLCFSSMKL